MSSSSTLDASSPESSTVAEIVVRSETVGARVGSGDGRGVVGSGDGCEVGSGVGWADGSGDGSATGKWWVWVGDLYGAKWAKRGGNA